MDLMLLDIIKILLHWKLLKNLVKNTQENYSYNIYKKLMSFLSLYLINTDVQKKIWHLQIT